MKKTAMAWIQSTIEGLLRMEAVKATKYVDTDQVVRAVRKRFNKKIIKRGNIEVTLTLGRPNFIEREFIKKCKKAGEPFPVKKIQFKLK